MKNGEHQSQRWKAHERGFATWSGGERVPSQGVACEDLRNKEGNLVPWTAEHKTVKAVPVWMSKQINQARGNAERLPDQLPLMYTTIAPAQGKKRTRIVAIEVEFGKTEFADAILQLIQAAQAAPDEDAA